MFWRNLTKINQICVPYKFAQSGCIPPEIKCEIKGSQTTRATPRDYLASWNRKPIGQRDLLASTTMDPDFSGKVTHCRQVFFFFISIAQWSVEEDDTIISKVAKGKGKTRGKNEKNQKMSWGERQRIDIQLSKLPFEAIVNVFVSRLVIA